MKDVFDQLFSLGLGIAVASKEQVERVIDDLVEKGNMTKNESSELVDELIQKGRTTQEKMESSINERIEKALHDLNIATKAELDELRTRIAALESKLEETEQENTSPEEKEETQE
jgi:polyhydroxyalkanoate synthesis regulator phasin